MKTIATLALILLLTIGAQAQQRVYLMERTKAVNVLKGANASQSDFTLYTAGARTTGRVAVTIDGELSPEKVRNALLLSLGEFVPSTAVKCDQTHRGEVCTGDAR